MLVLIDGTPILHYISDDPIKFLKIVSSIILAKTLNLKFLTLRKLPDSFLKLTDGISPINEIR